MDLHLFLACGVHVFRDLEKRIFSEFRMSLEINLTFQEQKFLIFYYAMKIRKQENYDFLPLGLAARITNEVKGFTKCSYLASVSCS